MLVIRDAQIQSFIAQNEHDVLELVCQAVFEACGERVKDIQENRLIDMVNIGMDTARMMGATRPEDIAAFVVLMFEFSPTFYRDQFVSTVLNDPSYPIGDLIAQLPERVPAEAWDAICEDYDPAFWFRGKEAAAQ